MKVIFVLLFVLFLLNHKLSDVDENSYIDAFDTLPLTIAADQIKPLIMMTDENLQNRLERQLSYHSTWDSLIACKKMAVGLVDMSDPYHVKFAHVNGDVMMYAASLPKLAILLGAAQALEEKSLKETKTVLKDMRAMISKSDNEAATRMVDRIGLKKIEKTLRDPRYELYDVDLNGGLWMGKRYAKKGKRVGDPLYNISHGATVTQVCRFYYLLAMGKLVSWQRSKQMLDILIDPEIHHKFVNSFDQVAPDADIYRKSGTWKNWHSDSALVWGSVWRRYIVVGLVEDYRGEKILRNLIPAVENVLLER